MRAETEMLTGKKAVIFDLDGTLIDSMWLWKGIDKEYLGRFGIAYPKKLPDLIGGMSFSETAVFFKEYFGIPRSVPEIMDDWNRMAEYKYTYEVPLKPGVKEFLCRMKTEGRRLGLATSNSRELTECVLKAHDILKLFDVILTSGEVGKGKPAPDVYLSAAERLKVSPEECLVFEDVTDGILAGKKAGMTVCAVEDDYSAYQMEEKRRLADYLLADFNRIEEAERLQKPEKKQFLPVNRREMLERGWEQPDFVYVMGDAYVDHPSYGPAIISRVLESRGYKVCMLPQPDYRNPESVTEFGRPKLGFLVCAGNMDTMVNHYTAAKKKRNYDYYSPGGVIGKRPDRATIVYCGMIRRQYGNIPIIAGGIEASLRRLAHYDYWSGSVKKSILLDSGADLISYGMGERSVTEIADALASGIPVREITFVAGTVYKTPSAENVYEGIRLPSYQEICGDKRVFAESFYTQYQNTDAITAKPLIEQYGARQFVVQNPPARPLSTEEMDEVYALPYMRDYHPVYREQGGVPGVEELKFSLTSCRGCFGGCSFCALTFHQGRTIQVRSHESLLAEAEQMLQDPDFKGYIHDVGGPTANFRKPSCRKQLTKGVCADRQCLFPKPCPNLEVEHRDYIALLQKLRSLPGVKKVFIRSGIRFDYLMADSDSTFIRELCQYHVSGQLKVAPEHISDAVLKRMGKPSGDVYEGFIRKYKDLNHKMGKEQFVVPYLMSSHPGSTLKEAVELAEYCRDLGYMPEQVQDFYPTPSTLSTCMYYTGLDPRTMEEVYVPKTSHEKAMQRALIQYRDPKNYDLVKEALERAGRTDLIGFGEKCLIRPRKLAAERERYSGSGALNGGRHERQKEGRAGGKSGRAGNRSAKKKTIRNTHKKK